MLVVELLEPVLELARHRAEAAGRPRPRFARALALIFAMVSTSGLLEDDIRKPSSLRELRVIYWYKSFSLRIKNTVEDIAYDDRGAAGRTGQPRRRRSHWTASLRSEPVQPSTGQHAPRLYSRTPDKRTTDEVTTMRPHETTGSSKNSASSKSNRRPQSNEAPLGSKGETMTTDAIYQEEEPTRST